MAPELIDAVREFWRACAPMATLGLIAFALLRVIEVLDDGA
jgi:hypothetical protein